MQKYVLGFLFDQHLDYVVLIEKQKPEWQKGFLNGVGGKVEAEETSHDAMVREFKEETGAETTAEEWYHFVTMEGRDWQCECFYMFSESAFDEAHTTTEEEVVKYHSSIGKIKDKVIANLQWLIPMAMDHAGRKDFQTMVEYL